MPKEADEHALTLYSLVKGVTTKMILHDFHSHTCYSSDSQALVTQEIEGAIEKGLKGICITDHMDIDYPCEDREGCCFVFDHDKYFEELSGLKNRYKGKIDVYIGIETGLRDEATCREKMKQSYEAILNSHPFDFVLGSVHCLEDTDPYFESPYWDNRTAKEGLRRYFEATMFNAKYYDHFDSLGHIDYVVRYVPKKPDWKGTESYIPSDYMDVIDEILKTLIAKGKALECNSAGLKYGLGFPHPKIEILKRYKELGGELLTIGSDGHKPEHLAYDFAKAEEIIKQAGFKYYTVYEQRKPGFIRL